MSSTPSGEITIRHESSDQHGAFVIEREGKRLAELTYTVDGKAATLDHTEVNDALRGQGAGAKLVKAAVEWARASGTKLNPKCSYARAVFDKTPDYADVRT